MSIYKRNFFELNTEEKEILQQYRELDSQVSIKGIVQRKNTVDLHMKMLELYRKGPFILNVNSYFPNNFLNDIELATKNADYNIKLEKFIELIDKDVNEREVLNFIRDNEAHFIIGSILCNHTLYGHHDRYIFQEFPLPPNHQADFLIVGRNSMGFHFLFIELENPSGKITLKDGAFGETIRKGIGQVNDWKHWLDKNFSTLINVFNKYKNPTENLPSEFYEYDSTRMEYVVIAGRRKDFNDKTYLLKRESAKNGIKIFHYDNIIDETKWLLKTCSY
ncbi:protein of unknown function [Psychroflexus salarius]|uniref:Shedu protein SduA C-terminal domain-containing protein n=1 Tax=Psychroflexus salarius TaxID=1155689 RepID=A0A1M4Y7P6_9FLAO|nr:Shedu anti-phage system protein SduA domain-containing protein [Psychroflexus salarius]SHF01735.1 protein of unknown function [Psychroflexus salarius]